MKPVFTIFLLLFAGIMAKGQNLIKGSVKNKTGKPVKAVNIAIRNSYEGTISDSAGNFSFEHFIENIDTLDASAIGYIPFVKIIRAGETSTPLNIVLEKDISELDVVVVRSAGSFLAGGNSKGIAMSTLDILTTSTNGDITTALKFLPGAQQVGEKEGLFVRGGTGNETKQYIDGAVVQDPFFKGSENYAQRGRFNPYLFSGTTFSTGGYSAVYGDALSAVVLLNSVDMPQQSEYNISLSPLMLGTGLQHLSKNRKTSFGASYGYTSLLLYLKMFPVNPEIIALPEFHTVDINFRQRTKKGIVKFFVQFSNNKIGLRETDADSMYLKNETSVKNTNVYANANWKENLGNGWKLNWSNSFSVNKDDIKNKVVDEHSVTKQFPDEIYWMNRKNIYLNEDRQHFQTRMVLEKKFAKFDVFRFGGEYSFHKNDMKYNEKSYAFTNNYYAGFAELDHYFSTELAATLGARSEYSSVLQKSNLAPRASVIYRFNAKNTLSAACGIFYQQSMDKYLLRNNNPDFEQASHYILNYTKTANQRLFRAEIFYKEYKKLIKTRPLPYGNFDFGNFGRGYARGLDIFWKDKKTIPGVEYWISYSYLDAKRNFLNYPVKLQPDYATPHTFSLVAKKFVMPLKTQFNFTYSFATGRPYYHFFPQDGKYVLKEKGKTPAFHNAGFSVNYVPFALKTNSSKSLVVVFTVSNLFNNKQIYGYKYAYDGSSKLPLSPFSSRFYFLGLFLNLGADRSQQVIDNNL